MRLFLFLVGGTGSRVMKPLVMQFAAGVHPIDEQGMPLPLEVVPIIVDPHKANADLKATDNLLRWYKQIHHTLYGDRDDVTKGFFSVKISTLADVAKNTSTLANTFLYNMGAVESKKFMEFIEYNTLDTPSQALTSMLFTGGPKGELETTMDIGFVGSPNIGSVVLNQFKDSEEFKQFCNIFDSRDRIFVVSSIFGGTGAAGYPVIVKNIRNASQNMNLNNRGDLQNSRIGALTVLPYFSVEQNPDSPITKSDFISKTKSALYYYHDNLTGLRINGTDTDYSKVNACYYLGDPVMSNPYQNDPGQDGQHDQAHIVEFVGALSILDFLQIPDDMLMTQNGLALNPIFKEYGLANDVESLNLKDLGMPTRQFINRQMVKFQISYMYVVNQLSHDIGRGYTEDKPEIKSGFLSTPFFTTLTQNFYGVYYQWLLEMSQNRRSFTPFNLFTTDLSEVLIGIPAKSGLLNWKIDYKHVLAALNVASKDATKIGKYKPGQVAYKLFDLLDSQLDSLIEKKYDSII